MILHGSFFGQRNHNRDVIGKALASHIARFRQTIMNYHGPFDRKHDSE